MNATSTFGFAASLPSLRRYARALTGNQITGDRFAAATLEALLQDDTPLRRMQDPREGLYHAFHAIWSSAGAPIDEGETTLARRAQAHMAHLTANSREALLLHTIEGFDAAGTGRILGIDEAEAQALIADARAEMAAAVAGRVLVIEDEMLTAIDIRTIVEQMGHAVTGISRTASEAVALCRRDAPDLVLADIQLADNSSGIDAVNEILSDMSAVPVVFITGMPERLLTGTRPEPAFVIAKPYTEDQIRSAVSQAMFFASTETLQDHGAGR